MTSRPAFILSASDLPEYTHVYPQSDEPMGPVRSMGSAAGLARIGVNLQRLMPGRRSSWPHAESDEEEFVYVIEGEVDAWIDGTLHRMKAGDFAGFPAGTGISPASSTTWRRRRCCWWAARHLSPTGILEPVDDRRIGATR